MDSIFMRRSIRQFEEKAVEEEKLELLLRAAMQAPSSENQQPWEFLVITQNEVLQQMAELSPYYTKALSTAALSIVPLGNTQRMKYPGDWLLDLSAACQNILLEATSLKLGAVWMGVETDIEMVATVKEFLHLPEHIKPFAVIAVGYPAKEKAPADRFDKSRIHYETYKGNE